MTSLELDLADLDATERAGALIARWMASRPGGVLSLSGDLGAGKTSLARGVLRAMGVRGPVRSPSYTLVEPYECNGRTVLHMDLYRLQDPDELEGLGLRDFSPDLTWWIVEWPERGAGHLPEAALQLRLSPHEHGRRLKINFGSRAQGDAPVLFSILKESFSDIQQA